MQHTARHRSTPDDLRVVIEHWTHMRDLIDTSQTSDTWPPAMGQHTRTLDHARREVEIAIEHAQHLATRHDEHGRVQYECVHCDYVGEGGPHTPRADRAAEQLGERPVPLRLHVVDACVAVEGALCALADEVAAAVQLAPMQPMRPVKHAGYTTVREAQVAVADRERREILAALDAVDPSRWSYTSGRSAVRAAEWLLDRFEGTPGPFRPLLGAHRIQIAVVAREAARRIERTIGGGVDRFAAAMGEPCPYCGGELVMHAGGGEDDTVTCSNPDCKAPVGIDGGRRTWSTAVQLAALQREIGAAARRRARAEARARQRAAARARQAAA